MSEPTVVFDHVTKRYRRGAAHDSIRDLLAAVVGRGRAKDDFNALDDVSFHVSRGEALGIVGPNGSGKSTALKLMTGILLPTTGSVRVEGRIAPLIEVGAGFHPDLSGRENIWLNAAIMGMTRTEARESFGAIVEFSGLAEFLDTPVKRYSSGMYMRLGFAIAAHMPAEVLVVDEVLAVGDVGFRARCLDRMDALKRQGRTILFVSHHSHQVRSLCDRVVYLKGGKKLFDGDAAEGTRRYHDDSMRARPSDNSASGSSKLATAPARIESVTITRAPQGQDVAHAVDDDEELADGPAPIRADAPLDVLIRYTLAADLGMAPVLSVSLVRHGDGVTAAVLNSAQQAATLPLAKGTHEVLARVAPLPLAAGRCSVEVLLWDGAMVTVLDQQAAGSVEYRLPPDQQINRPGVVRAEGSFRVNLK